MSSQPDHPGLARFQQCMAAGNLEAAREALFSLSESEQDLLTLEMGESSCERLYRSARGPRRALKKGRVVVIHGIMGSLLDSVDPKGDADRIWTNVVRLLSGRIDELELDAEGGPVKPGFQVRVVGQHRKTYAPMVFELDQQWHVRPFAYDWREQIDRSAVRLQGEIAAWAGGEPVHIVAHSMGGLVSRRFIRMFPDLWRSMQDGTGKGRGGRLVMLGTPNYGSYAIPLALSGGEKLVRMLAMLDRRHDLPELLSILASFPGSYQMLPSPSIDLGDDHGKLFEKAVWGDLPVRQNLLDLAARFISGLHDVTDPQRFVYIAGYDRPTPARIKIKSPGQFSYQETRDGDGRVPHALGLLPGVPVYWVDELHGNLPRNGDVLDAIHELLETGATSVLDSVRPTARAMPAGWKDTNEIDPVPPEFEGLVSSARGGRGKVLLPSPEDDIRIEGLLTSDYLGTPGEVTKEMAAAPRRRGRGPGEPAPAARTKPLSVEVIWGDITQVEGDLFAVGHYQGVLPQQAELALDRAVSGPGARRMVLTEHTRRGILRGALGDIDFFPWGDPKHAGRVVAVAGMGRPGSFGKAALRRLIRDLTWAVASLPNIQTVCSVLIGSGEGTLEIAEAVDGLVAGLSDALEGGGIETGIDKLIVVERFRHRAELILKALRAPSDVRRGREGREEASRLRLKIKPAVTQGRGGLVADEDALALALGATALAARSSATSQKFEALQKLVEQIPAKGHLRARTVEALRKATSPGAGSVHEIASHLSVGTFRETSGGHQIPTRLSFSAGDRLIRVAAITSTTTVPERDLRINPRLVDDLVESTNRPEPRRVPDLSDYLTRLLVPRDFRSLLEKDGPFILEVDRFMARVHWEIMIGDLAPGARREPISVRACLARQLRTTYSPAPLSGWEDSEPLRALVIGDPGDPARGESLPGALEEALKVRDLLIERGVQVDARIGSRSVARRGLLRDVLPASLGEVLHLLMKGRYDVVHYCGHGDFDPEDPSNVGWVFAEGLLTARELERIDEAPQLVVANACLSGRTSLALERGGRVDSDKTETGLLPSLADEFFHLGVRNYIGTAWEVNDTGAVLFAETLYKKLIPGERASEALTIGEAVRIARSKLYDNRRSFGSLWAAYQHYGDPEFAMRAPASGRSLR